MTVSSIFGNISGFSPLLAIGVYIYRRNFDLMIINILIGSLVLALCSDILCKYYSMLGKENLHVLDIYFPANLIVVVILYYNIYLRYSRVAQWLCTVFIPSLAFCYVVFWRESTGGQNINWAVSTTLIELMAIGHFYVLCKTPVSNIKQHAPYWISIGLFLYSSVSIVIFSLYKYLLNNYQLELGMYVWSFHNLMNIVGNTCFAIAVWYGVVRHETNLSPISISQNSN